VGISKPLTDFPDRRFSSIALIFLDNYRKEEFDIGIFFPDLVEIGFWRSIVQNIYPKISGHKFFDRSNASVQIKRAVKRFDKNICHEFGYIDSEELNLLINLEYL
jgi:hypothetical protein